MTRDDIVVPDDLSECDQWVLWRRETVAGRETKVPYSVRGHRASSTNPGDWTEFQRASMLGASGRGGMQDSGSYSPLTIRSSASISTTALMPTVFRKNGRKASSSDSATRIWRFHPVGRD